MLKRLLDLQKLQSAHHTFIFVAKNTLFSTFYKYWGKKLLAPIAQTHSRQSESIRTAYPLELHFTPISASFKQKIIPSVTQFSIYNYFSASHPFNFYQIPYSCVFTPTEIHQVYNNSYGASRIFYDRIFYALRKFQIISKRTSNSTGT